jgi:hypothetical protein
MNGIYTRGTHSAAESDNVRGQFKCCTLSKEQIITKIFFFFLRNHMLQIVDIGYIDTLFSNTIYVVGF